MSATDNLSLDACKQLLGGWLPPLPVDTAATLALQVDMQLAQARAAVSNRVARGDITPAEVAALLEGKEL